MPCICYFRNISFILFFLCITLTAGAYAIGPVPDTGQTSSYTDTFGEDSDYSINPPSYTKLGGNGVTLDITATQAGGWMMTRDNVTGLIWEIKTDDDTVHDMDNTYSWYDPNPATNGGDAGTAGDGTDTQDFISALNSSSFGGFSDWRMPTRKELRSIAHFDENSPAIDTTYFPNTKNAWYWSSDTWVINPASAWYIWFDDGSCYRISKSNRVYVRAVRGRQNQESDIPAFVDNGNGTITDTVTGLMWQQADDGITGNWESAINYCEGLSLAEFDDWRLPNFKELDSIADLSRDDPAINPVFTGTKFSHYWSSTREVNSTNDAWHLWFGDGDDASLNKGNYFYKRAVRGGQIRSSGHLVISAPAQGDVLPIGKTKTISWDSQSIPGNVSVTLSRDGGKTFSETLSSSTPNNGSFQWTVIEPVSYNCVMKVTPLDDTSKTTAQGLFTISEQQEALIKAMPWILLLMD